MIFKEWLLLNENIESNFDDWLKAIIKYAKLNEKDILWALGLDDDGLSPLLAEKSIIIRVLGRKHLENLNWLSFSIGYLSVKRRFQEEDLELAIDVTKRRIAKK